MQDQTNILGAEIHVYSKISGGHYTSDSKRVFKTELEAQQKFDELTAGGFEHNCEVVRYRWDLIAIHRTEGVLCRRTLFTVNKD